MQTLDQTLMEVEPIFREVDDRFSFTHPSFQEVLTAKQFADEINSGELSVRDAYVNFWSYEEDAELWGLPKDREWRALLPAWRNVLLHVVSMLSDDKAQQLVDAISECYNSFIKNKKIDSRPEGRVIRKFSSRGYYTPFTFDFEFTLKLIARNNYLKNKIGKEKIQLLSSTNTTFLLETISTLEEIGYYDDRLFEVDEKVMGSAISAIGKMGFYTPKLLEVLDDHSPHIRAATLMALANLGHFDEKIYWMAQHDHDRVGVLEDVASVATESLGVLHRYDLISNLLSNPDPYVRTNAIRTLAKCGHYDEKIALLLDDEVWFVAEEAFEALIKLKHYDPKVIRHIISDLTSIHLGGGASLEFITKQALEHLSIFDKNVEEIVGILVSSIRKTEQDLTRAYTISQLIKGLVVFKKFDNIIFELLSDPDTNVRVVALEGLTQFNRYYERILGLLSDDEYKVRCAAIRTLTEIGEYDDKILPLLRDPVPVVRYEAYRAFMRVAGNEVVANLALTGNIKPYGGLGVKRLTEGGETTSIREYAIDELQRRHHFEKLVEIIQVELVNLEEVEKKMRQVKQGQPVPMELIEFYNSQLVSDKLIERCVRSLGESGFYHDVICELLPREGSLGEYAVKALGELRHYDPRILNYLNGDKWQKIAAIEALAKIGHYNKKIGDLLKHKDGEVRKATVIALGELRRYDSRLLDLLDDEALDFGWDVVNALGQIGYRGEDLFDLISKGSKKGIDRKVTRLMEHFIEECGDVGLRRKMLKKVLLKVGHERAYHDALLHISIYDKIRPTEYVAPKISAA